MGELQRLLRTAYASSVDTADEPLVAPRADLSNLLRIVSSTDAQTHVSIPQPSPKDWSGLIDLVRAAARQAREVQAQARQQEARFEEALQRARDGIIASDERAHIAEAIGREAQLCAEVHVTAAEGWAKAAEERARKAEQHARDAEGWLARVQETILSEFADLTVLPDQAAA
ncbi:hypothetical protein [Methylobacterium sp. J-077]|uniref:hypothetical protein n=1 Tax=Methylobacterium sp. J-077 TaxID=2836656 RepID=UPI001FB8E261|nr:hypothetical protein [Methylobacterium sp. J-077]MCJ2125866.1 hypothetical protein [Methylobacterium sp. J-077]